MKAMSMALDAAALSLSSSLPQASKARANGTQETQRRRARAIIECSFPSQAFGRTDMARAAVVEASEPTSPDRVDLTRDFVRAPIGVAVSCRPHCALFRRSRELERAGARGQYRVSAYTWTQR